MCLLRFYQVMHDWCACDDQEDADDVVQHDDTDSATSRQCHTAISAWPPGQKHRNNSNGGISLNRAAIMKATMAMVQ